MNKNGYRHEYNENEGNLYIPTSNRGGKKFQTWTFTPINGERIKIEIDLMYPDREKPLRFKAVSNKLSRNHETPNIEELRVMVEHDLQNSCYLFNGIVWEEWYEVTVSGSNGNDRGFSSEFKIKYGKLKKGIDPKTGQEMTINHNDCIVPFPIAKKRGDDGNGKWSRFSKYDEVSYIPVAPENTAALELLTIKLGSLRDEVSNLLSQDNLKRTLKSVDKNLLIG